jgi:argininosuccinate lyase
MSKQTSRSGAFTQEANQLLNQFNASIMFDKKLYKEDIKGSIAHSKMLLKQNIITHQEQKLIQDGLVQIQQEIQDGIFKWKIEDEDLHMAIESRLSEIIGQLGGKLHTARSRNDQVATDFRLYVLKKNILISDLIKELISAIHTLAQEHTKTLIPGMTHLQHAQPINFAYHLSAYMSMFIRDHERFINSYKRNNISPLGCAALAGTPHNIDREYSAKELGFDSVSINCLDSVSDRDFALEILFNISTLSMHISRLSEELILWSSYEFKFITISDKFATGSSIMPQKKNPDVPELLRGKSGRIYGNLISLFTTMKGLPLAYNKDTQEDKEGVFDSVENIEISLRILTQLLGSLDVHKDNMQNACNVGHLTATDLADYLVKEANVPFRETHDISGKAVKRATELGVDISELSIDELQKIDKRINDDIKKYLDNRASMNARDSQGGTSSNQTQKQLDYFKEWLLLNL